MIASDQNTGQRRPEVFAHMARIRRWNGGVWFGVHALLDVDGISDGGEISWDIHVGDAVLGM